MSAPMAWTIPAFRNTQSPGFGVKVWSVPGVESSFNEAWNFSDVIPGMNPE
jgi:hypothetical protein